jgi:hypothetical protein
MREISIEEIPQGCVLTSDRGKTIVISSPEDVKAIIESLQRLRAVQQGARRTGHTHSQWCAVRAGDDCTCDGPDVSTQRIGR